MNRRTLPTYVLVLIAGLAIGWAVHGRTTVRTVEYRDPLAVTFEAGHDLRVFQSEKPGNAMRLIPFSVKRGEHRETFGEGPADPLKLWLVTYDDVVISCRSESP